MKILDYLLDLFYTKFCFACGNKMFSHENIICTNCDINLPRTHFHLKNNNYIEMLFSNRCKIFSAAACFYYLKEGKVQQLIHNFKYKGNKDIGLYIGEKYGIDLMKSDKFSSVDCIIPVPLHPDKLRKRGFNQSEIFGMGLSKTMNAVLESNNLFRQVNTDSQTRKSKWERYKNVQSIFGIKAPERLENKHVLIVDDVITTGATIESCIVSLQSIKGIKISVATIAVPYW